MSIQIEIIRRQKEPTKRADYDVFLYMPDDVGRPERRQALVQNFDREAGLAALLQEVVDAIKWKL